MTEQLCKPNLKKSGNKNTGTLLKNAGEENGFFGFSGEEIELNSIGEEFLGFPILPKSEKVDFEKFDELFHSENEHHNQENSNWFLYDLEPETTEEFYSKNPGTKAFKGKKSPNHNSHKNDSFGLPGQTIFPKSALSLSSCKKSQLDVSLVDPGKNLVVDESLKDEPWLVSNPEVITYHPCLDVLVPFDEIRKREDITMSKLKRSRSLGDMSDPDCYFNSPVKKEADPQNDLNVVSTINISKSPEKEQLDITVLQDNIRKVLQDTIKSDHSIRNINMKIEVITTSVTREEVDQLSNDKGSELERPKIIINAEQKKEPEEDNMSTISSLLALSSSREGSITKDLDSPKSSSSACSNHLLKCVREGFTTESNVTTEQNNVSIEEQVSIANNLLVEKDLTQGIQEHPAKVQVSSTDQKNLLDTSTNEGHSLIQLDLKSTSLENGNLLESESEPDNMNLSNLCHKKLLSKPKKKSVNPKRRSLRHQTQPGLDINRPDYPKHFSEKMDKEIVRNSSVKQSDLNHSTSEFAKKVSTKRVPSKEKGKKSLGLLQLDLDCSTSDSVKEASEKIKKSTQIIKKIQKSIGPDNIVSNFNTLNNETEKDTKQKRKILSRSCKEQNIDKVNHQKEDCFINIRDISGDQMIAEERGNEVFVSLRSPKGKKAKPRFSKLADETPSRKLPSRKCKTNEDNPSLDDRSVQNLKKQTSHNSEENHKIDNKSFHLSESNTSVSLTNLQDGKKVVNKECLKEYGIIKEINVVLRQLVLEQSDSAQSETESISVEEQSKCPQEIELETKLKLFKCLELQNVSKGKVYLDESNLNLISKEGKDFEKYCNKTIEKKSEKVIENDENESAKSSSICDNTNISEGKAGNEEERNKTIGVFLKTGQYKGKKALDIEKSPDQKEVKKDSEKITEKADNNIKLTQPKPVRRNSVSDLFHSKIISGKPLSRSKSLACLKKENPDLNFDFKDLATSMLDVFSPMRITRSKVPVAHKKNTEIMNSVLEGKRKNSSLRRPATSMSKLFNSQEISLNEEDNCQGSKSVPNKQFSKTHEVIETEIITDSQDRQDESDDELTIIDQERKKRAMSESPEDKRKYQRLTRSRSVGRKLFQEELEKDLLEDLLLETPKSAENTRVLSRTKTTLRKSFQEDCSEIPKSPGFSRLLRSKSVPRNTIPEDSDSTGIDSPISTPNVHTKTKTAEPSRLLQGKGMHRKTILEDSDNTSVDSPLLTPNITAKIKSEDPCRLLRSKSVPRNTIPENCDDSSLQSRLLSHQIHCKSNLELSGFLRSKSVPRKTIPEDSDSTSVDSPILKPDIHNKTKTAEPSRLLQVKGVPRKTILDDSVNTSVDSSLLTPNMASKIKSEESCRLLRSKSVLGNTIPEDLQSQLLSPQMHCKSNSELSRFLRSKSVPRKSIPDDSDSRPVDSPLLTPFIRSKSVPRRSLPARLVKEVDSYKEISSSPCDLETDMRQEDVSKGKPRRSKSAMRRPSEKLGVKEYKDKNKIKEDREATRGRKRQRSLSKEAGDVNVCKKYGGSNNLQVNLEECTYKDGSFVWAQIGKYPFWPAMVCKDPLLSVFAKKGLGLGRRAIVTQLHVRFFNDNGKRAWVPESHLMMYCSKDDLTEMADKLKELKIKDYIKYLKPSQPRILQMWNQAIKELETLKQKSSKEVYSHLVHSYVKHYNETHRSRKSINVDEVTPELTDNLPKKRPLKRPRKEDNEVNETDTPPFDRKRGKSECRTLPTEKTSNVGKFPPIKIKIKLRKNGLHSEFSSSADNSFAEDSKTKKIKKDKTAGGKKDGDRKQKTEGTVSGKQDIFTKPEKIKEKSSPDNQKFKKVRHSLSGKLETTEDSKIQKVNDEIPRSDKNTNEVDVIPNVKLKRQNDGGEISSKYSYEYQVDLHRKNNPFNGMGRTKVCTHCLQPGELHKCKGKCGGVFHLECASKVMLPRPQQKTNKQLKKPRRSGGILSPAFGTPTRSGKGVRNSDTESTCSSRSSDKVQIVNVRSKGLTNLSNPNVPCLPPTFNQLTLDEQIDYRMKEIKITKDNNIKVIRAKTVMSRFDEQITYADSSSTDTSSEEGSGIYLATQKVNALHGDGKHSIANGASSSLPSGEKIPANGNGTEDNSSDEPSTNPKTSKEKIVKHVTADSVIVDDGADLANFKCEYCRLDKYPPCGACGLEVSSKGVSILHKCSQYHCFKTFHKPCLRMWPQAQWSIGKWTRDQTSQDMFTCPSHVCHTCFSEELGTGSVRLPGDKLARCLLCPASYHASTFCVPAGSEVLGGTQLICPRHRRTTQPLNTSWCFICSEGGNLVCCDMCPTSVHPECQPINFTDDDKYICEDCESGRFPLYDEVVWVKLGSYRWWPALVLFPNEVPENMLSIKHQIGDFAVRFFGTNDHYWVSKSRSFLFQEGDRGGGPEESISSKKKVYELFERAIEDAAVAYKLKNDFKLRKEAESITSLKPPPFVKTLKNKPVGNVKQLDLDLSNTTACECDPNECQPCGLESDCINRLLLTECDPELCPADTRCRNQSFEKREYPPMVPYKTQGRGWGLKTLAPIKKGQFVIEYVGDLIDQEEYQRRIKKMHETKEENYYFMTLDNERMIDAGPKGNISRFMNHSCNPNCETQKWTVRGDTKVGLFALKDIEAGAELTFNYNLECVGQEKKTCKCGAANCSGFIGAKAKPENECDSSKAPMMKPRKLLKKKPEIAPLPPCFICSRKGAHIACTNKLCNKNYHLRCLDLTEKPEVTKYVCPRHNCNLCTNRTIRCCVKCINSFCPSHSEGNIRHDKMLGFVCSLHDPKITLAKQKVKSEEEKRIKCEKERERRKRIINDPKLRELQRQKEHERYIREKEKGIRKTIEQFTPREQIKQRQKWKLASKKYQEKLKARPESHCDNALQKSSVEKVNNLRKQLKQFSKSTGSLKGHDQRVYWKLCQQVSRENKKLNHLQDLNSSLPSTSTSEEDISNKKKHSEKLKTRKRSKDIYHSSLDMPTPKRTHMDISNKLVSSLKKNKSLVKKRSLRSSLTVVKYKQESDVKTGLSSNSVTNDAEEKSDEVTQIPSKKETLSKEIDISINTKETTKTDAISKTDVMKEEQKSHKKWVLRSNINGSPNEIGIKVNKTNATNANNTNIKINAITDEMDHTNSENIEGATEESLNKTIELETGATVNKVDIFVGSENVVALNVNEDMDSSFRAKHPEESSLNLNFEDNTHHNSSSNVTEETPAHSKDNEITECDSDLAFENLGKKSENIDNSKPNTATENDCQNIPSISEQS